MIQRRAFILLGVLVVVVMAASMASVMLEQTNSQHDLAEMGLRSTQSRSLAWSGMLAVRSELAAQREDLLAGKPPTLTRSWSVQLPHGEGVIRVLAWPTEEGSQEQLFVLEGAKLSLASCTSAMLAKLPGATPEWAASVIGARGDGFESVESLEGLGLAGEVDAKFLTTFSADPTIQMGIGDGSQEHAGKAKINLAMKWSEPLEEAFRKRFGADFTATAAEILKDRQPLKSDGEFVTLLIERGVPPEQWSFVLDVFCTTLDPFRTGRTDVNSAQMEVLSSIPGISEEKAKQIVERRETLTADVKLGVAWPVTEGILTATEFVKAVDWLTVRCLQYRVRVEAGVSPSQSDGETSDDDLELRNLRHSIVLEGVIDLSDSLERVAYLRDITYLRVAKEFNRVNVAADAASATDTATLNSGAAAPESARSAAESAPVVTREQRMAKERERTPRRVSNLRRDDDTVSQDKADAARVSGQDAPPPAVDRRVGRWTSGPRK